VTVDHEGDELLGQLHPPNQFAHGAASTEDELIPVVLTLQEGSLLLQVAATKLDATRRRSLPPPMIARRTEMKTGA
jgi:hypothetical protein